MSNEINNLAGGVANPLILFVLIMLDIFSKLWYDVNMMMKGNLMNLLENVVAGILFGAIIYGFAFAIAVAG